LKEGENFCQKALALYPQKRQKKNHFLIGSGLIPEDKIKSRAYTINLPIDTADKTHYYYSLLFKKAGEKKIAH
jgi:hypothetical protein